MSEAAALAPRTITEPDTAAELLRERMHSPLCGLLTSMGYLQRLRTGGRMYVASGDLTGVHVLQNQPPPRPGSFHLGGSGLFRFESRIRVLAESLERYAGHAAVAEGRFPVEMRPYRALADAGEPVLPARAFSLFSDEQYGRTGFPFDRFDPDAAVGWIRLPSLLDDRTCWVPAQRLLLGYIPCADEPWMTSAVTTGTAAHTDPGRALLSALEELIQLDSAVGHWHGGGRGVLIEHDGRTAVLNRIVARHFPALEPEFHLLRNADLPGFTVACLLRGPSGRVPEIAVGLGSGNRLVPAMYRALLEAAGVQWLATWVAVQISVGEMDDGGAIYDLESNVGRYAMPGGAAVVEERFAASEPAAASDLPPDGAADPRAAVREIVDALRRNGQHVSYGDLTTRDIRALGFTVMRVWSPDLLSLPLPSAPPTAHPRFAAYQGYSRDDPHPYP